MYILWSEFAGHGLCDCTQPELGRSECGETLAAANAGSGAREEHGPAAALGHVARRLSPDQKSGVAGKFPGLEEELLSRFEKRLVDVGAGVKEADLDRSNFTFNTCKQAFDFIFLSGIHAESMSFGTGGEE